MRLRSRRSLAVSIAAAVAVAASAAAIGLGVWAASLHHSLSRARRVEAVIANPHTRRLPLTGAQGALYVAPSGEQYEAWVIRNGAASPAGVFSKETTLLRLRVNPGVSVAVTVEQAGGVSQPTGKPILSTHV